MKRLLLSASLLLLASAERMVRTAWSYIACGVMCVVGLIMIVFFGGVWVIAGTVLIGGFAAAILVLILALPPLISEPTDVHRVTAGMFTISYSCAVVTPIVSGALWDVTGMPIAAFIPVGFCACAVIALAPTIVMGDKTRSTQV